jgi:exonuclease SbcD
MTRLAVLADPHCDDFGSKIDPATGLNARWVDTVAMVEWVARDAQARGADALLVLGDLTESRHPAPWRVAQIGAAIAAFEGPVVLLKGNHDGERAGRSIVDVLAAGRPTWSAFSADPGLTLVGDVAIASIPYVDRHWLRSQPGFEQTPDADVYRILAEHYLTIARGLYVAASGVASRTVLAIHQGLAGGNMSDSQRAFLGDLSLVVDSRALGAIGFDAILAGHFHLHQVLVDPLRGIGVVGTLAEQMQSLVVYAGSPYRTDFGEEHQEKGYLIVDVDGPMPAMTFVPTPARRFVTLTGPQAEGPSVSGAIVRVLDFPPDGDVAGFRQHLELMGAFDVQEIRIRRDESPVAAGGLAESLAPTEALEAYFADHPDRDRLVARGREILEAVR